MSKLEAMEKMVGVGRCFRSNCGRTHCQVIRYSGGSYSSRKSLSVVFSLQSTIFKV